METFRADLHCHSLYSDGTDTPTDLISLAMEKGLSGLSITDHDTVAAYAEALPFARERNFPLLSGVEFSASYAEEPVHILGYAFSLDSSVIQSFCLRHQERREERNRRILKKLEKLGHFIPEEELRALQSGTLGRPHIAALLIKRGVVGSVKEAFQKYLAEGKPAYDPGERVTVEETIEAIHQGGGVAVLAHPHLIHRSTTIRALLKMPFDGIEGYYAKIPLDQEKKWLQIAQERKWIVTGGSDYHGTVKPQNPLGSSWVNGVTFKVLYDQFCQVTREA